MIEFVLLDLDDTILDFKLSEHTALQQTLGQFGLTPTEEVCSRYSAINKSFWEMLERKEITRAQLRPGRFEVLFQEYGLEADPMEVANCYEKNLSSGHFLLPGAEDALKILSQHYKLYIVSNGNLHVQRGRLQHSGILPYFQGCFISEEMGASKPDPLFFQNAFARIPDFDPNRAIIVGDSLTSDILGGIQAGIATCWVRLPGRKEREDIRPDHTISALFELPALLKTL